MTIKWDQNQLNNIKMECASVRQNAPDNKEEHESGPQNGLDAFFSPTNIV